MKYLNKNFLGDDGLLNNIWIGDQNGETVRKTHAELNKLIVQLQKSDKKVLILTDTTKIGKITLSARTAGVILMRDLDFHKAAIFGARPILKGIVDAVSFAAGEEFRVKLFGTEEEARKWLSIEYV